MSSSADHPRAQRAATLRRGRGRITTIRARRSLLPPGSATSGLANGTWSRPRRAPAGRSNRPSGARSGSGQEGLEAGLWVPDGRGRARAGRPCAVAVAEEGLFLGWSGSQTATGWCVGRRWPGSPGSSGVDGVDDLGVVDPLEIDRGDPEVGMPSWRAPSCARRFGRGSRRTTGRPGTGRGAAARVRAPQGAVAFPRLAAGGRAGSG